MEADRALVEAEEFSANELAGRRVAPGNSGTPGIGPVRMAAQERVVSTRRHAENAAQELDEARGRLRLLQDAVASAKAEKRRQASARLVEVSEALRAIEARRDQLEAEHRRLTQNREAIVRAAVEADPVHVRIEEGFIAHVRALKRLAADPEILIVFFLFDAAFFSIEAAAVLAKIASFVPTTYATRLALDAYLQAYQAAQSIARIVEGAEHPPPADEPLHDGAQEASGPEPGAGSPSEAGSPVVPPQSPAPSSLGPLFDAPPPRPRGRPPKVRPDPQLPPPQSTPSVPELT